MFQESILMLYYSSCTSKLTDRLLYREFFCPFCLPPPTSLISRFSTDDLYAKYISRYKISPDNSFGYSVSFISPSLFQFYALLEKKKKSIFWQMSLSVISLVSLHYFSSMHGHFFYYLAVQDLKNIKEALFPPPFSPNLSCALDERVKYSQKLRKAHNFLLAQTTHQSKEKGTRNKNHWM